MGRRQKGGPDFGAEQHGNEQRQSENGQTSGGKASPIAARRQRQGDHHTELRLVSEKAEQQASQPGPFVQKCKAAREQRGRQKAVMPVGQIDEDGGEGQRRGNPAIILSPLRHRAAADQSRQGPDIERQRRNLPEDKRQGVRKQRQRRGDQKEERRIVPAVKRRRIPEDRLLLSPLAHDVERRGRRALQNCDTSGIDV